MPVVLRLSLPLKSPTAAMAERLANPAAGMRMLPQVMRRGPGSVEDQFRRQGTIGRGDRFAPWPRPKPFGRDAKFQARSLKRTGRYLAAWLGQGAGALTAVGPRSVSIGVARGAFPQVRVLQGDRPTAIRVTPRMRGFLGAAKGVHLRRTTQVLIVEPRAFRVNSTMIRRARTVLVGYVINGPRAAERAALPRAA